MRRGWTVLLSALLVMGCSGQADEAEQEPSASEPPSEIKEDRPLPPPHASEDDNWYEDPCVTGSHYKIDDVVIHVPIPCAEHDIDMGDPPPF